MPFQPGQSGNPAGPPPRTKLFREALLRELKAAEGDNERISEVARKLVENALGGETAAIKEVADRLDGKVKQVVVGGDDEDDPIRVVTQVTWTVIEPATPSPSSLPSPRKPGSV